MSTTERDPGRVLMAEPADADASADAAEKQQIIEELCRLFALCNHPPSVVATVWPSYKPLAETAYDYFQKPRAP